MASSWSGYGPSATVQQGQGDHDKRKKPQQRQLLSCTKCRERKVKCDRMKPCTACCARGHPKECEFIVSEGNDYSPIQQSYEIKKLRQENLRLKELLREARHHQADEGDDSQSPERESKRAAAARQRRFRTGDRVENLYFGTPGLANIVSDFANLQVGAIGRHSLTHPLPRGQDIYKPPETGESGSSYPFATLWIQKADTALELLNALPDKEELYTCLQMFQNGAPSCSFPHVPDDATKREIERFLENAQENAERHPDMLALVFATLATGTQLGVYESSGDQWLAGATEQATKRADVYVAASVQALRMASFMNQPTLLGIQALIMLGPYLTNSGRFLDAWTLFGTTIRLAHSIGLHRNPKLLDPTPDTSREVMIRQSLWWWMLHMDQHYSVTLGRPLGISGFGDCPPAEPLTTNPTVLRLGEFVDHFTILARQILSSDGMVSVARIDEFTDKLMGLWDTMPEQLQFNESWLRVETTLPEWPLDVMSASLFASFQSYIILLNRQRDERTQSATAKPEGSPPFEPAALLGRAYSSSGSSGPRYTSPEHLLHPAPIRGRALVINSSIQLLQTFLFFYHRRPQVMICWSVGQQAFNACMILILDALETGNTSNEFFVQQAFAVFTELDHKRVHKLAAFAVQRISDGLTKLEQMKQERNTASQSASTHRQQQHQQQSFPPELSLDTAITTDITNESVMGNTGMFLLEDPGLQSLTTQQTFQPLMWTMAGSNSDLLSCSGGFSPGALNPIPVSQVTATPFPVMAPPYVPTTIPVTNSPFAVGLQPRMPTTVSSKTGMSRVHSFGAHDMRSPATQPGPSAFASANSGFDQPIVGQHHYALQRRHSQQHPHHHAHSHRALRSHPSSQSGHGSSHASAASAGPRGIYRPDRPHRSQQRRK